MSKEKDFGYLESQLESSLLPVNPRPDFVRELGQQLASQFRIIPTVPDFSKSYVLWFALALLFSIFLVLMFSIRAVLVLVGILNLLYQPQQKTPHEIELE